MARHCISEISRTASVLGNNPAETTITTGATFQKNNAKPYVPVVVLSINNNIKFLEHLKHWFRTVSWNKYRSGLTIQPKKNDSDYMIDLTFRNINKLFVVSFKDGGDDSTRNSFDKY